MTQTEKDALYEEFRNRLIGEMASQFIRQNDVVKLLGQSMLKWSNELTLEQVLTESDSVDEKSSSGVKMRACGICLLHTIPLDVEWEFWLDGKPVHSGCLVDMMVHTKP